jgi:multidrug resistance efflux pump
MQMTWTDSFKKRVLLNASKAYVAQSKKGDDYEILQPVYALNFVNENFISDVDEYYHYYHLVHDKYTDKVIDGLHLIFVELPKFKPQTISERKMQVLWLRFLTEIDENTREAPAELLENTEVNEALEILERAAFTDAEMRAYDKFWDRVSTMRTLESDWEDKIKEAKDQLNEMKAKAEEAEAKVEEAKAKVEEAKAKVEEAKAKVEEAEAKAEEAKAELKQKDINTARRMKGLNVSTDVISQVTGLSNAEIEAL